MFEGQVETSFIAATTSSVKTALYLRGKNNLTLLSKLMLSILYVT
jgi:hypothetical protein